MTAHVQPAVDTSFSVRDQGIYKNILEYLVFNHLPEDNLGSILCVPMVFHITTDLYLGKSITLAYLLYFQTVDYFAFLTRKPDLSLRKFFISTCHVSIKTAIFSGLILIGLFVLILSFCNNHYKQSVTIGRRNVHFLLEIKQHWKTELIKTVNYFIKKSQHCCVCLCNI